MRFILLFLFITNSAFAYDQEMVDEFVNNCDKNQLAQNVCAWNKANIADEKLNTLYKLKYNSLTFNKNNQTRLKKAQRAWMKFRDENCLYDARGSREEGGSMFPMAYHICIERMTKKRIIEIEEFIACTSDDCPQ